MLTNTYLPHVGGVARSVHAFAMRLRKAGNEVLVVAPEFDGAPPGAEEPGVFRVPALRNFNGSGFSVRYPLPVVLSRVLQDFGPEIVHSHHPFLLGDTAARLSAMHGAPLVFTYHTMYEDYAHYASDTGAVRRFISTLAARYADLCDHVVAPSRKVESVLRARGSQVPISVIPTGVDAEFFARGDRARLRGELGIPPAATLLGHIGRLAPEKNLSFLARAVACYLRRHPDAHFLVVGEGPSRSEIESICSTFGVRDRLHLTGALRGRALADAYCSLDVFVFASRSETQGMVVAEALAAGVPVVAIDDPAVVDVVHDERNGYLVERESPTAFSYGVERVSALRARDPEAMRGELERSARELSMDRSARRLLEVYVEARSKTGRERGEIDRSPWAASIRLLEEELLIWRNRLLAAERMLFGTSVP